MFVPDQPSLIFPSKARSQPFGDPRKVGPCQTSLKKSQTVPVFFNFRVESALMFDSRLPSLVFASKAWNLSQKG